MLPQTALLVSTFLLCELSAPPPSPQVYNYTCCQPNQGPNGEPPGGISPSAWLFKTPREFGLALKWLSER